MRTKTPTTAQRLTEAWGSNVAEARRAARITQVQMAKLVSRDQTTISKYEKGRIPFTPDIMLAFAIALDTTVTKLFPWPPMIEDSERYARVKSHLRRKAVA